MIEPPQICLASASPRRRELLDQIGMRYQVLAVDIPEVPRANEAPAVYVQRLALQKARAGWQRGDQSLAVLGADTEVVLDGEVLGKPRDREHGLAMLERLSGRSHSVLTAVALVHDTREAVRLCESTVAFRPTSAGERAAYWATGEPVGKAGAYAIQGHGAAFIARLEGSYSGVMGLALYETVELLAAFGIDIFREFRPRADSL